MRKIFKHIETPARKEGAGWYTAMFFFLEHARLLSAGAVNHKALYARLSERGNLINHENPRVRKSTAATLSRTIHSLRYAADIRATFEQDNAVFDSAATWLYGQLAPYFSESGELVSHMANVVWADVLAGLENEQRGGRDVDLIRVTSEMSLLKSWAGLSCLDDRARFVLVTSSMMRIMAFGSLDAKQVHQLADETVLDPTPTGTLNHCEPGVICLIRSTAGAENNVSGVWALVPAKTYVMGRYADSDIFDPNPHVSRRHCLLTCKNNTWYVKNESKSQAVHIIDAAGSLLDSIAAGASDKAVKILPGQGLEFEGASRYWFLGMDSTGFNMVGKRG